MHSLDEFGRFGELGRHYQATDWAATPLGPPAQWDRTLRRMLDLLLSTRFPMLSLIHI